MKYVDKLRRSIGIPLLNVWKSFNNEHNILQPVCKARVPQLVSCTSKYEHSLKVMTYFDNLSCMGVQMEVIGSIISNSTHDLTSTQYSVHQENFGKILGIANEERVQNDTV